MRRQQLTETEIAALFDPPMGQRELVRHYTLSAVDIAMIRRRRGDHSRLGHALMLCYLRHPGRPLRTNERPPSALVSFVRRADRCSSRIHCRLSRLGAEPPRRRSEAIRHWEARLARDGSVRIRDTTAPPPPQRVRPVPHGPPVDHP